MFSEKVDTLSLTIGRIPYLVCAPFFHGFSESLDLYFVDGHPAEHNEGLRKGEIDASPSSCIEYARSPSSYRILPEICTGGGPEGVGSVVLFSELPLEKLTLDDIQMTSASATSVVLLKVLARFYWKLPSKKKSEKTESKARLLIGDEALREKREGDWPYVWDMGRVWFEWQKLPFVFGLWMVRREVVQEKWNELTQFYQGLLDNVEAFEQDQTNCLLRWNEKFPSGYPSSDWKGYFGLLRYRFGEEQKESLMRFFELASQLNLCEKLSEIEFAF